MTQKHAIADQLLAQEIPSVALQDRCRKEVEAMLERNLKPAERIAYPIVAAMCTGFAVVFSLVAWQSWGRLPPLASVSFAVGAVFSLLFTIYALRVLRKGRLHLKKDLGMFNGLVWTFMILMMTLFLVLGQQMEDTTKGTQIILVGLVFFVTFGVVGMFQYNIQQAELRMRESILRLELQLAALADRLPPKS